MTFSEPRLRLIALLPSPRWVRPAPDMCSLALACRCLNPSGSIPGRLRDQYSSAVIRVEFTPLEAREYSLTAPIHLSDGTTMSITIRGTGFHPRPAASSESAATASVQRYLPAAITAVPPLATPLPCSAHGLYWASCPRPNHPVTLSHELVEFVAVPSHHSTERVVLMKNTSATEAFTFKWEAVAALPVRRVVRKRCTMRTWPLESPMQLAQPTTPSLRAHTGGRSGGGGRAAAAL